MKNKNQHIDEQLLIAILEDNATEQDWLNFQNWIDANPEHDKLYEKILKIWKSSKKIEVFQKIDEAADWKIIKAKSKRKIKLENIKLIMRYAASILVLISLSLVYFYQTTPGFGKYEAKQATSQSKQLLLADGTKVFLNQKSKIIYPKKFDSKIRSLELEGEAYFEVKRNPDKAFVIHAGDAIIKVLGTSFNVENKADGTTIVCVNSGKVSLKNQNNNKLVYLSKDERGIVRKQQIKEEANTELNYKSWKTGILKFKATPMLKVFKDIEKHYNVKITNKSHKLDTLNYTNSFTNTKLSEIIEELKIGLKVQVVQKRNHLLISDQIN